MSVEGVQNGAELQRVLDADLRARARSRPQGVVLTEYLAREILGIEPGEILRIEVLEGRRAVLEVPVRGRRPGSTLASTPTWTARRSTD